MEMKYDLTEFEKLIDLLIEAGIPYTRENMYDTENQKVLFSFD